MVTPCPLSRYFPIHSNEMANKRLDKTRINENFGQYSFLSLVRHFVCFENDHRHGDHVMVGDVDHCFRFFQNWHTPELFQELKKQLASAQVLAYFDKDTHTRVIADTSPVGLGAFLVQDKNGQSRVVSYASRSLSSVERRYNRQTEKEALALVWACDRFNLYLLGLPTFDLVTDHEALKVIYSRGSDMMMSTFEWLLSVPYL